MKEYSEECSPIWWVFTRINNQIKELLVIALQVTTLRYLIISLEIGFGPEIFPVFSFCIHLFISLTMKGLSVMNTDNIQFQDSSWKTDSGPEKGRYMVKLYT